ncbi:MAG: hypothetical protein JWO11_1177, partial [Nocardioides sp.]|nr:hypothetical protein [Nocardioides sp.]
MNEQDDRPDGPDGAPTEPLSFDRPVGPPPARPSAPPPG